MRARIGSLGVVAGSYDAQPEFHLVHEAPITEGLKDAGRELIRRTGGFIQGFLAGWMLGASVDDRDVPEDGDEQDLIRFLTAGVGVVLAPAFGVIGFLHPDHIEGGRWSPYSQKPGEELARSYLYTWKVQDGLRDSIYFYLSEKIDPPLQLITGNNLFEDGDPSTLREEELRRRGLDSLLIITVQKLGLKGGPDPHSPLTLEMEARARLVFISKFSPADEKIFEYVSKPRVYAGEGQSTPAPQIVAEELEQAYLHIARKVHDQMILDGD